MEIRHGINGIDKIAATYHARGKCHGNISTDKALASLKIETFHALSCQRDVPSSRFSDCCFTSPSTKIFSESRVRGQNRIPHSAASSAASPADGSDTDVVFEVIRRIEFGNQRAWDVLCKLEARLSDGDLDIILDYFSRPSPSYSTSFISPSQHILLALEAFSWSSSRGAASSRSRDMMVLRVSEWVQHMLQNSRPWSEVWAVLQGVHSANLGPDVPLGSLIADWLMERGELDGLVDLICLAQGLEDKSNAAPSVERVPVKQHSSTLNTMQGGKADVVVERSCPLLVEMEADSLSTLREPATADAHPTASSSSNMSALPEPRHARRSVVSAFRRAEGTRPDSEVPRDKLRDTPSGSSIPQRDQELYPGQVPPVVLENGAATSGNIGASGPTLPPESGSELLHDERRATPSTDAPSSRLPHADHTELATPIERLPLFTVPFALSEACVWHMDRSLPFFAGREDAEGGLPEEGSPKGIRHSERLGRRARGGNFKPGQTEQSESGQVEGGRSGGRKSLLSPRAWGKGNASGAVSDSSSEASRGGRSAEAADELLCHVLLRLLQRQKFHQALVLGRRVRDREGKFSLQALDSLLMAIVKEQELFSLMENQLCDLQALGRIGLSTAPDRLALQMYEAQLHAEAEGIMACVGESFDAAELILLSSSPEEDADSAVGAQNPTSFSSAATQLTARMAAYRSQMLQKLLAMYCVSGKRGAAEASLDRILEISRKAARRLREGGRPKGDEAEFGTANSTERSREPGSFDEVTEIDSPHLYADLFMAVAGTCGFQGDIEGLERLCDRMERVGFPPDPTTFSIFIGGCLHGQHLSAAAAAMQKMVSLNMTPSPQIVDVLLRRLQMGAMVDSYLGLCATLSGLGMVEPCLIYLYVDILNLCIIKML